MSEKEAVAVLVKVSVERQDIHTIYTSDFTFPPSEDSANSSYNCRSNIGSVHHVPITTAAERFNRSATRSTSSKSSNSSSSSSSLVVVVVVVVVVASAVYEKKQYFNTISFQL